MEFERGYYVMDLFEVLDAQQRVRAGETLDELNNNVMSHTTDAENFRNYTSSLARKAGFKTDAKPAFDESGFKRMQAQMRSGRM